MKKKLTIGIDWATNRWHAIVLDEDGNLLEIAEQEIKMSIKPDQRRMLLCEGFLAFLTALGGQEDVSLELAFEEPLTAGGRSAKGGRSLAMTAGALQVTAHRVECVEWHWIHVSKWKAMVGKDKSKEAAKLWFLGHFGQEITKTRRNLEELAEDHYDAGCIAVYFQLNREDY